MPLCVRICCKTISMKRLFRKANKEVINVKIDMLFKPNLLQRYFPLISFYKYQILSRRSFYGLLAANLEIFTSIIQL